MYVQCATGSKVGLFQYSFVKELTYRSLQLSIASYAFILLHLFFYYKDQKLIYQCGAMRFGTLFILSPRHKEQTYLEGAQQKTNF